MGHGGVLAEDRPCPLRDVEAITPKTKALRQQFPWLVPLWLDWPLPFYASLDTRCCVAGP